MKGQAEELIWISVITAFVLMLGIFFFYQFGIKGTEVRKEVESTNLDESATLSIITIYSDRLPYVEKFYLETGIDALLYGTALKGDLDKVFYGTGVGTLNVSEVIPPLMNKYFGNRWQLLIETPKAKYRYGNLLNNNEIMYSYSFTIPVPEEKFGTATLEIGKLS